MKKVTKEKKNPLPSPPLMAIVLACIAFFLSGYLFWSSRIGNTQLAGCGGSEANCEQVITTKWGTWFGIPVSAGALLIYGAIFLIAFAMRKSPSRNQWFILICLSAAAAFSALWFIGLQIFEVRSYCMYCMAVHACGLLIATLVLKKFPWNVIDGKKTALAVLTGMIGVGVLAAGQLLGIKSSDNQVLTEPIKSHPTEQQTVPLHQEVTLAQGKLQFSLDNLPIIGSRDASNFVAHFFDYTCPACRKFHSTLKSTQQTYESQTSLLMIPVPLDATCNPAIRETAYIHQNACAFAKIGLTIWRISPESYAAYDEFMFKDQFPPALSAAQDLAAHLAGKDAIDRALADPEVMNDLSKGIRMFYSPAFQQKALPALVSKSEVITGFPPPDLLTRIFSE